MPKTQELKTGEALPKPPPANTPKQTDKKK